MNNPVATRIADIEDKRGGLLSVLELASSNGATFVVQFLDRSIMRVEIIDGEGGLPGVSIEFRSLSEAVREAERHKRSA